MGRTRVPGLGLALALALVMLVPRDASASGNARVDLLEPELHYSYTDSVRKILRPEDHDSYWQRQDAELEAVLHHAGPTIRGFVLALRRAGIPLRPMALPRAVPEAEERSASDAVTLAAASRKGRVRVALGGGDTILTLHPARALDVSRARALLRLAERLDFHKLSAAWRRQGARPAPADAFRDGLLVAKHRDRYSLAVALTSKLRAESYAAFKAQLQGVLHKLGGPVDAGLGQHIARGTFWLDDGALISLERKLGAAFAGEAAVEEPARSRFNPRGPLFDEFGRRSNSELGHLTVCLLFVSDQGWDDSDPRGANRGGFEQWLRQTIRTTLLARGR